jgi:sortase A
LLFIEVGAVIGLIVVLVSSYLEMKTLNNEMVAAQLALLTDDLDNPIGVPSLAQSTAPAQPNPAALPFNQLPGGHSSPSQPGGAVPDIPAHLQNWVQPPPPIPVSQPIAAEATRIVIPKINVDAPIVAGVTWEDLKKGVGHLPGSAQPGQRGNMYLAAHNDIFGEIFRHLDKLDVGDEFHVYAGQSKYTYIIREKRIIEPTDVEVMLPTTEPVATLQTCYPYLIDTHRLIVVADLVS